MDSWKQREKKLIEKEKEEEDPLAKAIGICEGPSDSAERHDKYILLFTSYVSLFTSYVLRLDVLGE